MKDIQRQAQSPAQMRKFGLTMLLVFTGIFGLALPYLFHSRLQPWALILGCMFGVVALVHPQTLGYVFIPWMLLARAVGWANSRILLFIVFCTTFIPVGAIMRWLGKDPMNRSFDKEAKSYRVVQDQVRDIKQMERPF